MDSPAPDGKERFLTAPMIAALAVSTLLLALNYLAFPGIRFIRKRKQHPVAHFLLEQANGL